MKLHFTQRTKLTVMISGTIMILTVLSAFLGLTIKQDEMIRNYIYQSASSYFDSILLTRRWNANYGGVYVEKKAGMASNPYLKNPDISADNGRTYTLKNPALMTRELSEMAAKQSGFQYHITSLKVINPGNVPDEWEREALTLFERGGKESSQIIFKNGKNLFRLMRPLYYEQGCIKCHSEQGYSIGQVRGGISVSLPYDEISAELNANRFKMFGLAGLIIVILAITFYFIIWKLVERLSMTSAQLEEEKTKLELLNSELDERIVEKTRELANTNERLRNEIKESERAHKTLIEQEEQLRHVQKLESLGVLAGGIAHDFNNILTAITGNADLALLRLKNEAPLIENLQQIETAAARAADLTKQMLAYSGKGEFVIESVDINKLLEEMGQLLEVSISKKALLRYDLTRPLPPIDADVTQIRQVVMNLVINASEALGDQSGTITIATGSIECDENCLQEFWLTDPGPPGLYVFLEITDTGCGMNRETMERIFDPFFTTKFTGRGLGMATVLGIIRGHKGAIKVFSEPGKGSSFKVMLPVGKRTAERFDGGVSNDNWIGSGAALLVDDEETVRAVGSDMLRELGFEVETAGNGREAIEVFKRRKDINVVILDLTMPHMDGIQCFKELRQLDADVKVIMSSGFSEYEVTHKLAGNGLAGFVQKPYKLNALRDVLHRATSK